MSKKNDYVFGVNTVPEWEEGDKLYIFIDEKTVWNDEKEYDGKIRDEKICEQLKLLGVVEESEPEKIYVGVKVVEGGYKDNPPMTRQEIVDRLTELGFEYDAVFEKECVELGYP